MSSTPGGGRRCAGCACLRTRPGSTRGSWTCSSCIAHPGRCTGITRFAGRIVCLGTKGRYNFSGPRIGRGRATSTMGTALRLEDNCWNPNPCRLRMLSVRRRSTQLPCWDRKCCQLSQLQLCSTPGLQKQRQHSLDRAQIYDTKRSLSTVTHRNS